MFERYGPPEVIRIADVPKPQPEENELLIRVLATTVNRTDCGFRGGNPLVLRFLARLVLGDAVVGGVLRPKRKILGDELSGVVEAVGPAVKQFKPGDEVFGSTGGRFGTQADYVCMRESDPVAHKPANMTFEEAAAVCDGAILTLNALRPAHIAAGQRVLVYGASGSMGTAGVQLTKALSAHVTAVCETKSIELVRSLGADEVIDRLKEDFVKNGRTYDVIYDAVGKLPFGRCRHSLGPHGAYLATDGMANVALAPLTARRRGRRVLFSIPPRYTKDDVLYLKDLIEARKYRAVIDRTYPLEQVVEATRYVETGQKVGNVVLTVGG